MRVIDAPRPARRPLKRSDALEQLAVVATTLSEALDDASIPTAATWAPLRTAHRDLQAALDQLGRARARGKADEERLDKPAPTTDARGYKRASSNTPGAGKGRVPKNRGRLYPPDPPTVAEIVALIRGCPDTPEGRRLRALIPFLWRTGLRISEALAVMENDLNAKTGSVTVRKGKGGKRRVVGMDSWGWEMVVPWLEERVRDYPAGPVFCVINGPTVGRGMSDSQVRLELKRLAARLGIRRRIAPHQFRHAMACDIVREGRRLDLLQRQLGHSDLSITTNYLASVTNEEVVGMAQERSAPTLAVPDLMEVLRG